jgi:hypothetical protein
MALAVTFPSAAQDRAMLSRVLREGSDFRVRVQAAFAIGNTRDPILRPQLERALRDEHPAVRAAAATALGRLGSTRAIPALRRVLRDSAPAVRSQAERSIEMLRSASGRRSSAGGSVAALSPMGSRAAPNWSRIRAAVVVGDMRNRSAYRASDLESRFRSEVQTNLQRLTRVHIFETASQMDADARSQLSRRRVPMLRLDGSLTAVQPERRGTGLAVRCEVSLVLLEEPGRNLRGMLRGAATGLERSARDVRRQEARLAEEAMSAAVRSAMSTADVAISRAARH